MHDMLLGALAVLAIGNKPVPKFGAWVILDDDGTSYNRFASHVACFDSVSGQFYSCTKDGLVEHVRGVPEDRFKSLVDFAHRHRVAVFGLVGDGGLGAAGVEFFVNDPVRRQAHAVALAEAAVADKLDGIDLDYESMKAGDKDNFSLFVEAVSQEVHKRHKLLTIALCAKDTEPGDWSGSQSEDYARIGKAVDRARVMTYDEHEDSGPAGPVADLPWVRRVMVHALEFIPRRKLEIGIPAYGYNWSKPKAHSLNWTGWTGLPNYEKAARDPISNELTLPTADGTAWFCDSVSEKPKLDLATELRVRGVYMWVMGSEDPKWWDLLEPRKIQG